MPFSSLNPDGGGKPLNGTDTVLSMTEEESIPAPSPTLIESVRAASADTSVEGAGGFVETFRKMYGGGLRAVILYGSYLSSRLRKPSSTPDFVVLCADRRSANLTVGQRILYGFLPPHVLSGSVVDSYGKSISCKYNVLTQEDFGVATRTVPEDLAIAGRLGKRVAVLYAAEECAPARLAEASSRCMVLNAALGIASLPERFGLDDFILSALEVSYRAEFRMTEERRWEAISEAEPDFYRASYGAILSLFVERGWLAPDGSTWRKTGRADFLKGLAEKIIARSRRNGKWRLVKYIFLFQGWTAYLVNKIERSQGERIALNTWERRFPLIFAWPHFFRLKREGRLR